MFFSTDQKGVFKNKDDFKVDFTPFIKHLKLTKNSVILHWNKQAKKWGFYDVSNNKYYLVEADQVLPIKQEHKLIDIFSETLPSCVLLYDNCRVKISKSIVTLESTNESSN